MVLVVMRESGKEKFSGRKHFFHDPVYKVFPNIYSIHF